MPVDLSIVESTTELGQTVVEVVLDSSSAPGVAGPGVPVAGTTGQVLKKASNTDYDTEWDDASAPGAHASSHQNGGADEVSVAGLSGLLADGQTPLAHNHAGEEITSGTVADARIAATIARDSEVTTAVSDHSADTTAVHGIADTSAVALTANHPSNATFNDHSARHEDGGADELSLTGLAGAPADTVNKSLFDANTVLAADSDNTPAAVTMAASTILARLAAGNIKAASVAEILTLLDVPTNAQAILDTIIDAKGDLLAGTAADTVARIAVGATDGMVLEVAAGASPGMQWDLPPGYEFAYNQITGNVTSTTTTEATAVQVVAASSVTFDGSTVVMIEFWASAWETPAAGDLPAQLALYDAVDGGAAASIGPVAFGNVTANAANTTFFDLPVYVCRRLTPTAAAHVYSIRLYGGTGTKTVYAGAGGSGVDAPAFIRITKV